MNKREQQAKSSQKRGPRFALPGYAWVPLSFAPRKIIREQDGWALVKKPKSGPTPEQIKKRLNNPGSGIGAHLEKRFPAGRRFRKVHVAFDAIRQLSKYVSVIAAKQQPTLRQQSEMQAALALLHYFVKSGCCALTQIAQQRPDVVQPIAHEQISWPLMMSTKPGYSVNCKSILNTIQLGLKSGREMHPITRADLRRSPAAFYMRAVAEKLYDILELERINKQNALPELTNAASVFKEWWNAARAMFLEAYPHPDQEPELSRFVPKSRKYPSHRKSHILRSIKRAFHNLALFPPTGTN